MNTEIQNHLRSLNACDAYVEWAKDYASTQEAWEACPRGDWLLWYAAKIGVDRKLLVRAACLCAREALQYVPAGEQRPLRAIETTEAWCRGEATIEEVKTAADAANYAADAASAASAAAYYAARAADCAAYAVASSAGQRDGARAASLARSADLVRQIIPSVGVSYR